MSRQLAGSGWERTVQPSASRSSMIVGSCGLGFWKRLAPGGSIRIQTVPDAQIRRSSLAFTVSCAVQDRDCSGFGLKGGDGSDGSDLFRGLCLDASRSSWAAAAVGVNRRVHRLLGGHLQTSHLTHCRSDLCRVGRIVSGSHFSGYRVAISWHCGQCDVADLRSAGAHADVVHDPHHPRDRQVSKRGAGRHGRRGPGLRRGPGAKHVWKPVWPISTRPARLGLASAWSLWESRRSICASILPLSKRAAAKALLGSWSGIAGWLSW
jgi:hypothetical protein